MRKIFRAFFLALACGAALTSSILAEPLEGRVVDPQDRPIAGAEITIEAGGATQRVVTDRRGAFRLQDLAAGPYILRIEAAGFAASSREGSLPAAELTVRLALEEVRGEIVVTSAMPELAGESNYPGERLQERGRDDLVELFRDVAGLSAIRRGPINLEPIVRGLQEDQVASFVDGTRTFAAGPARMDSNLSHVGPRAVENIRIVKGPYALAWGAGTLSAVEVETFRPAFVTGERQWGVDVGSTFADNADSLDSSVGVWSGGERFRLYLTAGRRIGDDYEDGNDNPVPGDYESNDSRWHFGFQASDQLEIGYSGGYQEQFDIDYPGRLLDATFFYARSHAVDLTWNGRGAGEGVRQVDAQVYINRKDHRMNNDEKPTGQPAPGRIPPFALRVDLPTESNTAGGRLRLGFGQDTIDWSAGLDYYTIDQTARRFIFRRDMNRLLFDDIVWPDAEVDNLGAYGQLVYHGKGFDVGAALRLDEADAQAGEVSDFFRNHTAGSLSRSESNVSAAINASFETGEHWTLQVGAGRAVRMPTVLELYSDRFPSTKFQLAAEFMGNPELDPEASLELDFGARGVYGDFVAQFDIFYRTIDDYITVAADPSLPRRLPLSPPTVFRYINGSEAEFVGGEVLLDHRVSSLVSWRGSLSWVRADDEALDEPVLGIAPLTAQLGLRLYPLEGRLSLDFNAKLVDRQDRVATTRFEQETPGYSVFDLGARFEVNRRLHLRGGIENLTDKAYASHLNSPNPFLRQRILEIGRSFRVGFELSF